jgi:predicted dehydrogenase
MRRIIHVGLGKMGQVWADCVAASDKWQSAAYVDSNRKNLIAAATRHGMPKARCYASLEKALREVEADALLDVTPQECRKEVCLAALDHGLHVLSEKPLADTIENAKEIVNRAEKLGRTHMVAQNYRYQPATQTAKRFIQRGGLGDVGYVGVNFHKGPHFGGFREVIAYPLLLDMAIHHVDMMRCILNSDVVRVQGTSINAPWNWSKGDATLMAHLEMANGVVVGYLGSWVAQGWETSWNGDWRFDGSKGVLLWERDAFFFSSGPQRRRKVSLIKWPIVHQAFLLEHFAKCLDRGEEPETSGRRNLNSFASTFALVQSVRQKRQVEVAELLK